MPKMMISELNASELMTLIADQIGDLVGHVMPIIEVTGMPEQQMAATKDTIKKIIWDHCTELQEGVTQYLTYEE